MNGYTQEIANLLGIDVQVAVKVQDRMEYNGIDYSECTQDEFNEYAFEAAEDLGIVIGAA